MVENNYRLCPPRAEAFFNAKGYAAKRPESGPIVRLKTVPFLHPPPDQSAGRERLPIRYDQGVMPCKPKTPSRAGVVTRTIRVTIPRALCSLPAQLPPRRR